ncbi:MAG: peptide chain release factor 1 [Lentisphaerae bacterium]|nr:peptide chain release factor 1 [Lentisphaerota bacterium]
MIERSIIERALKRLPELEQALARPDAAKDRRRYRDLVREHAALQKLRAKAEAYFALERDVEEHRRLARDEAGDPELSALAHEELGALETRFDEARRALTLALAPPDPTDARNAIMEIRAGTGGEEAALFAGDLLRMYQRYAEARGWKTGLIHMSPSDIGGCKEAVFGVEGAEAYGTLRYESGVHRVQRVPVTETSGRIHTSAATVAVFPEAEPEDAIALPPEDLRVDIFRSSGPGGQSVNTTDSAVRITHLPTGLTVQCQDEKSQHRNKERAMQVLKARLLDLKQREEAERRGDARRSQIKSGDRSERVRTYNFPQNRLTDHRINLTLYSLDRVMEGDLDALIGALREQDVAARLQQEA